MKDKIKQFTSRLGLFQLLDRARKLPEKRRWDADGFSGVAPLTVKRSIIRSYLRNYGLEIFVETGTHHGDTLAEIALDRKIRAISIELADDLFNAAAHRFKNYQNVELLHGDSGQLMPSVIAELDGPALFWLDGHYSGESTAKSTLETPVSAELSAIFESKIVGHVILIDDLHCFNGSHDYPHLDELLRSIRTDGRYCVDISANIIRLTPQLSSKLSPQLSPKR